MNLVVSNNNDIEPAILKCNLPYHGHQQAFTFDSYVNYTIQL